MSVSNYYNTHPAPDTVQPRGDRLGHIRDNWAARTRGTRGTRGAATRHVSVSVLQQGCTITIDGYPEICFVLGLGTRHGGAEVRETTKRSVA